MSTLRSKAQPDYALEGVELTGGDRMYYHIRFPGIPVSHFFSKRNWDLIPDPYKLPTEDGIYAAKGHAPHAARLFKLWGGDWAELSDSNDVAFHSLDYMNSLAFELVRLVPEEGD